MPSNEDELGSVGQSLGRRENQCAVVIFEDSGVDSCIDGLGHREGSDDFKDAKIPHSSI